MKHPIVVPFEDDQLVFLSWEEIPLLSLSLSASTLFPVGGPVDEGVIRVQQC